MPGERSFTTAEPKQLLALLIEKFPNKGRNKVKSLLQHRQVSVEGAVITRHDHVVHPGQTVTIASGEGRAAEDALLGMKILFEDDDLIVIDKPAGLLSMATDEERDRTAYRALTDYVRRNNPNNRVFIVHRLDRETSGVMMFAKRAATQQTLQDNWKDSVIERAYVAVVEGRLKVEKGTITSWLQESGTQTMYVGKPGEGLKAILHYQVLKSGTDYSLLEIHLETGRRNQIRVQMQHIGHPVVGDKRYGLGKNPIARLGLHARVLSFRHPVTGEILRFETPIPPTFLKLV